MEPHIDQYLLSTCLFILYDLNTSYQNYSKADLKEIADTKFNEMDIIVKIGYPFKQMVHYTVGEGCKGVSKKVIQGISKMVWLLLRTVQIAGRGDKIHAKPMLSIKSHTSV